MRNASLFLSRVRSSVKGCFPLLLLAGTAATAHADPAEDRIARLAGSYVDSGKVPGIIVGIWKPGAAPVVIKRGVSDLSTLAPMNEANSQRIASITKSFTVTRLLQLADEGRLGLDDPISKYVAGLRNGDATLRQLADMTSGIFNYTEDRPFILDFAFHPLRRWTDRKIVEVANRHAPYFPPGDAWYYSNTNTILLGMVVERVTGHSLREEITRRILHPLGLRRTLYPTRVTLPPPFSHGYATLDADQGRIDVTEISPTAVSGAGAMISTLDDLRLWGRSLARGSLLSRRAQFARLQMVDASRGVGPYYDRYGLALGRIDGWLGHTGDVLGFQSLVMHNLVADETVVIFVNASNPEHVPTELFRKITPLLSRAAPAFRPSIEVTGRRVRETRATRKTIRGRAASDAGILMVQYSLNGGSFRLARGEKNWRLRVNLNRGANVIRVRAIDRLGRASRPAGIVAISN